MISPEFTQILEEILLVTRHKWDNLDDKFNETICLLEHFSKITS